MTHGFIFGLIVAMIMLILGQQASSSSAFQDLMKKENIDSNKLQDSLTKIGKKLGEGTNSRKCQEELIGLQQFVEKDALSLMTSTEAAIDAICSSISKGCVLEIVKALKKVSVGGASAFDKMIESKLGFALPEGIDIGTLAVMYYESTCDTTKSKQRTDL